MICWIIVALPPLNFSVIAPRPQRACKNIQATYAAVKRWPGEIMNIIENSVYHLYLMMSVVSRSLIKMVWNERFSLSVTESVWRNPSGQGASLSIDLLNWFHYKEFYHWFSRFLTFAGYSDQFRRVRPGAWVRYADCRRRRRGRRLENNHTSVRFSVILQLCVMMSVSSSSIFVSCFSVQISIHTFTGEAKWFLKKYISK